MPVNYLLIESLQKFHHYYGDDFKVECPTGSGQFMTIAEVADELLRRLSRLFLKGEDGQRPVLQVSPEARDRPALQRLRALPRILPRRHGRGVGASHQTGWTGLIAKLLQPRDSSAKPTRTKASKSTTKRPSRKFALVEA
jgi:hypothetical protein